MCGLPPYTADRLIDVSVIDGEVEIRLAEYFERPLRLAPAEGLALLAAGRALLAVPGSDDGGPLATALGEARRRPGRAGQPRGRRRRQRPAAATAGRGSRRRARRDRLLLLRARRDDHPCHRPVAGVPRVRHLVRGRVVPSRAGGAAVPCRPRAGGARDGERFDPASRADDDARDLVYRPRPEDPRVTLWLAPAAEWVIESHPHESATRAEDGAWQVVLAISEPAWLERLLVALGPDATLVAPPELTEPRRGGGGPPAAPVRHGVSARPAPDVRFQRDGSARMGSWSNLGDRRRRSPHRRRHPIGHCATLRQRVRGERRVRSWERRSRHGPRPAPHRRPGRSATRNARSSSGAS